MTKDEFESKCRDLCPHCAAGEKVRQRLDTSEFVHDWSFGVVVPGLGRSSGMGHGICQANDMRRKEKDLVDG